VSLRERRLRELRGLTVEPRELQGLVQEKADLRGRIEALKEERIRLEVVLSEEGVEEDKAQAEEELQYLYQKGNRLIRKAQALELARKWLDRANAETLSSAARHMESLMGGYIGHITDSRYSKVSVDTTNFGLRLWSEEKGGDVDPEALSRGTIDQLYLAARLSLVDIICENRRPPLLLDDPFVTFDTRRLRKAMEVLKDFSGGRQVIIFTCSDLYDRYADRVVDLEMAQV
jgi:DNA repair exonuclease SbcCD ATPase subunit